MKHTQLFKHDDLLQEIAEGYIRARKHPTLPLEILNYSEKAQYEQRWNAVTRNCRGLIVDDAGNVVARPWPKFYNLGEHNGVKFPEIDLDAKCVTQDKLDGCFVASTKLNLWGGGTVSIGDVVNKRLTPTLVGMDSGGNLVPSKVTDWHKNGTKNNWLAVTVACRVSRRNGSAGHPNKIRVTSNHHILVNGEYRAAGEISPGDIVINPVADVSSEIVHIVRSSLLGDGCVTLNARGDSARYSEGHMADHRGYVETLRGAMGDAGAGRSDTVSGYGTRIVWAGCIESPSMLQLRRDWYPDGKKALPDDLSWIDDFSVAKMIMDDGYLQKFEKQAPRMCIGTNAFTRDDVERLAEHVSAMYGITYHLVRDGDRGTVLVFNSGRKQELCRMWERVAPWVHPDLRYKLPEDYRGVEYRGMPQGRMVMVPRECEVISVEPLENVKANFPGGRVGYDISTETENYCASGIIVHNSLGVTYPTPDGPAIATRGSFESDQAKWATNWLRENFPDWKPDPRTTYLFEIVYEANRIVLKYDFEGLVLLGCHDTETYALRHDALWPGRRAAVLPPRTVREALSMPDRDNAEGVVCTVGTGPNRVMVKIKQSDYVERHRVVTGLSEKTIWEHLSAGWGVSSLVKDIPDEFHAWVDQVKDRLLAEFISIQETATRQWEIRPRGVHRSKFAEYAKGCDYPAIMFRWYDDKNADDIIWNMVKPKGDTRMVNNA